MAACPAVFTFSFGLVSLPPVIPLQIFDCRGDYYWGKTNYPQKQTKRAAGLTRSGVSIESGPTGKLIGKLSGRTGTA